MTVAELTEDLERHPKDMEVVIQIHNFWGWEDYAVVEQTKIEPVGKDKDMVVIRR